MSAFTAALMAALVWSVSPILEKFALGRVEPMAGLLPRTAGVVLGTLVLLPFLGDWRGGLAGAGPAHFLALAAAGALASVLGQLFAYTAMKKADVTLVSPISASWPLLVLLFGWMFLGEAITARKAVGCVLVVGGIWLLRF